MTNQQAKEKLIKADIASIENRVRHAFNQGYDLGFKDGKKRAKPLDQELCNDWYDVPSDEMTLKQARQAVKDLRKKLAEYLEQEPTIKNDLGVENDLVSSIVEKISEKVTETHEEFIFETIRPYCENVVQMKISKRDLEQALLKYYGKND